MLLSLRCSACILERQSAVKVWCQSTGRPWSFTQPRVLQHNVIRKQLYSVRPPELDDPDFQKFRLRKRIFTWTLCMLTLGTVWIMKKRKKDRLSELLEDCQFLPPDPNYKAKMALYNYKGCVLPERIIKSGIMKDLQDFEVRDTDVVVASFPKCGTTWVQELVYLICTDLDFIAAKGEILETRFPYLEYPYPGWKAIAAKPVTEQRFIKTHLPYWLLPRSFQNSDAKVVYIARNPKDVSVSYYHFLRMMSVFSYEGSFNDFATSFMQDRVPYAPFFNHVSSYWEKRSDPNVLFLFYEDLIKDPEGAIKQLCAFLGKSLSSEEVAMLASHTRFDVMAQNPSCNYKHWEELGMARKGEGAFMRKGQVGDWKNYLSLELEEEMDAWIEHHLQGLNLKFTYTVD